MSVVVVPIVPKVTKFSHPLFDLPTHYDRCERLVLHLLDIGAGVDDSYYDLDETTA